jgi:hypothetical protein
MPDIEIILGSNPDTQEGWARCQILSYMLFPVPGDETKRKGFIALLGSVTREALRVMDESAIVDWIEGQGHAPPASDLPAERIQAARARLMDQALTDFHDSFGGPEAAREFQPEKHMRWACSNWLRAGIMFRLLIDFHHHYDHRATLADIFPVFRKHPALKPLRDGLHSCEDGRLYELWGRYKRVAHLCAAFSFIGIRDYQHCLRWKKAQVEPFGPLHQGLVLAQFPGFEVADGFDSTDFLGLARHYERFGRVYIPNRRPDPLIPDDAWLIPESWDLPSFRLPKNTPPHSFRRIFESYARTLAA